MKTFFSKDNTSFQRGHEKGPDLNFPNLTIERSRGLYLNQKLHGVGEDINFVRIHQNYVKVKQVGYFQYGYLDETQPYTKEYWVITKKKGLYFLRKTLTFAPGKFEDKESNENYDFRETFFYEKRSVLCNGRLPFSKIFDKALYRSDVHFVELIHFSYGVPNSPDARVRKQETKLFDDFKYLLLEDTEYLELHPLFQVSSMNYIKEGETVTEMERRRRLLFTCEPREMRSLKKGLVEEVRRISEKKKYQVERRTNHREIFFETYPKTTALDEMIHVTCPKRQYVHLPSKSEPGNSELYAANEDYSPSERLFMTPSVFDNYF